jgi:hypothetical protein
MTGRTRHPVSRPKDDSVAGAGAGAGYEAEPSRGRRGNGLLIARSKPLPGPRRAAADPNQTLTSR